MRKLIIPILSIIMFVTSCTSEPVIDKDAETAAIRQVVESMFNSIADANTDSLMTFLTEDFLAFDMGMIMKTKDLTKAVAGMAQMGITDLVYKIEPVQSDIYENSALFCYKNTAIGKMGETEMKMDFIENCFLLKTDKGWKIKFLQSTQVPQPTPEPPAETE